jgi:pseudouridine synthase
MNKKLTNKKTEEKLERLQKVIARAGITSRRKAEILILEGAVTVNGKLITELGFKVNPNKDKIKVNGKLIFTEVEDVYLILYKPKGVISALSDPEGRKTITSLLKGVKTKVFPIGRLDYNSEGILLLTNNGELAEKIFKSKETTKSYLIKVKGHPTLSDLDFLKKGIYTKQGILKVQNIEITQNLKNKTWIKLDIFEGANLDLRELLNRKKLMVDKIIKYSIGQLSIEGLKPGQYKFLTKKEFEKALLPIKIKSLDKKTMRNRRT